MYALAPSSESPGGTVVFPSVTPICPRTSPPTSRRIKCRKSSDHIFSLLSSTSGIFTARTLDSFRYRARPLLYHDVSLDAADVRLLRERLKVGMAGLVFSTGEIGARVEVGSQQYSLLCDSKV